MSAASSVSSTARPTSASSAIRSSQIPLRAWRVRSAASRPVTTTKRPTGLLLGVEADVGATNLHGARTCGTDAGRDVFGNQLQFPVAYLNCENTAHWMATAAARLGYAWGRTLYYVKAGGAITNDNVNVSCIYGPLNGIVTPGGVLGPCLNQLGVVTNGFSTSGTRAGWLVGFGTEFDLGKNWSAKAEYNYIDFGSRTATATDGTTILRDSGALSQVKTGVNYRFAGPTAVVAKY